MMTKRLLVEMSAAALAVLFTSNSATAAPAGTVLPGSAQQHALAVQLDGNTVMAHACRAGAECSARDGRRFAVPRTTDLSKATIEPIELVGGKLVALVSAPLDKRDGSWTLLLAASDATEAPTANKLLVGHLGQATGLDGERRSRVLLRDDTPDGVELVVGRRYENAQLCGRATTMRAQALDPAQMTWNPSPTRSLSAAERASATPLAAVHVDTPPTTDGPQLLHGVIASSAVGKTRSSLTDRRLDSAWTVRGDGTGEFLVMTASNDVAVLGFDVVIRPTAAADGTAPKSFYIATRDEAFRVSMPEDAWQQDAGALYRIDLPRPLHSDCFALVLDRSYAKADDDHITVAELRARTKFDGEPLETLVKALGEPLDTDAAKALLMRSGPGGAKATVASYDELDKNARGHAREIIENGECSAAAPFFIDRLLGVGAAPTFDPDLDPVAKEARTRLRLCKGPARTALAATIAAGEPSRRRVWAARELATIGPASAVPAILSVLEQGSSAPLHSGGSDEIRRGLRAALGHAAQHKRARAAVGTTLAAFEQLSVVAQIDLLRAIGPALPTFDDAQGALDTTLASDSTFRTRYLLQEPAAHLARGGSERAMAWLQQSIRQDESRHVRARAARVSAGVAGLVADLEAALEDDGPRVREAALLALSETPKLPASAQRQVVRLLSRDPWTFVRIGAAAMLAQRQPDTAGDEALVAVLNEDDAPSRLRSAALRALGKRRSVSAAKRVERIADNPKEPVHIRVAAISALGHMCYRDATPLLYKLGLRAGYQQIPYDQPLGLAALAALGKLKPKDMHAQLAPLLSKNKIVPPQIRAIARDVLSQDGSCQ